MGSKALPPSASLVRMERIVLPNHMNAVNTAFGGVIVSWIDVTGAISASRHCSKNVVTASIDDLHFLAPVHKGDVVCLKAQVQYAHHTSMEVEVKATAQNVLEKTIRNTVIAYLTFVALGQDSKPTPVPPLLLQTDEEKFNFEKAKERRLYRLKRREEVKAQFLK